MIIETKRLLLRPVIPDDSTALHTFFCLPEEMRLLGLAPAHTTTAQSEALVARWAEDEQHHALLHRNSGTLIGYIAIQPDSEENRPDTRELGFGLLPQWQHQGYMTEALSAVMDFLFDEVGFQRVEAQYDTRNPHSGGVMQKCGMTYEGTHRRSACTTSGICDTAWYAILADEREK